MTTQSISKNMTLRLRAVVFRAVLAAGCTGLFGAVQADEPVALFRSTDSVEVMIAAPWRKIVRETRNQEPYPATLHYTGDFGDRVEIPLTVERRGKTRQRICRFPPIRLRFDRQDVEGTLFDGNKSIKMVTHCNNGNRWEQYYVLEMLAYPIYNLVTERSFRVRPVSVSYRDSERAEDDGPRFAFLIEDDKLVAERNGLDRYDVVEIGPKRLDPMESSRFALFQYLIGNVDWSSLGGPPGDDCCHNAKLVVGPDTGGPLYAIPYDFDSSGLVNAHYAAPNQSLPISQVTERLFRGFCLHNAALEVARLEFLGLESAIESIVRQESRLTSKTRSRTIDYLGEFFAVLEDPEKFDREVTGACRK